MSESKVLSVTVSDGEKRGVTMDSAAQALEDKATIRWCELALGKLEARRDVLLVDVARQLDAGEPDPWTRGRLSAYQIAIREVRDALAR